MPRLHTVTVADLRLTLTEGEREALPAAVGGAANEETWLGSCLEQACDRVVGAINSCERNERILPGLCKLPAECVRTALVLARHAAISAIPGSAVDLANGPRDAEYTTATRDLERLAACELLPLYELAADEAADSHSPGLAINGRHAHCWHI